MWWFPSKGSWTHHTADWFVQRLAIGQGQNNGSGGSSSVSLYNDASPARYFYIYGLQANFSFTGQLYGQSISGTVGTRFGGCFPAIADQPAPPGSIYTGLTPASSDLITLPWTWEGGQPTVPYFSSFPLAVVPPGYSFSVYDAFFSAALIVTFWYVWK